MTAAQGENAAAPDGGMAAALGVSASSAAADAPAAGATGGALGGGASDAAGAPAKPAAPAKPGSPLIAPAAASASPSGAKRSLARRALDRVPLKWVTTAALVVFLGATAAFGGLEAVAAPETPVVELGETVIGAELEMTPVSVSVIDRLRGTGVFPLEGSERTLTLVMDVTNLSEFARSSSVPDTLASVRIDVVGDVAPTVTRIDDQTIAPWLQPGLPVRVAVSWVVPIDLLADGDVVRLALPTATRGTGQFVVYGTTWSDNGIAAYIDLAVEDLGRGDAA